MQETPREFRIEIQGRVFAGECWGSTQDEPVIALHGWLDNCHSFRPLASRLKNIQLLALDMAGHGHSEHRSADASYHIWDDVREILLIAREMGWRNFPCWVIPAAPWWLRCWRQWLRSRSISCY